MIKVISKDLGIHEDIITKVIAFQGRDAHRAVNEYNEVEFSGLGTIIVSVNKIKKKILKSERVLEILNKEVPLQQEKIDNYVKEIEQLNKRWESLQK